MTQERLRVLLVEDSRGDALVIKALVAEAGRRASVQFDVEHVSGFGDALRRLDTQDPAIDVVLLDLGLPDANGVPMVEVLTRRHPDIPVVVKTALEDADSAAASVAGGAQEFLPKGKVSPDELGRALRHAVLRTQLERTRRESAAEHRALFERNPYPIWIVDADSLAILDANTAAVRHGGWPREALLGMRLPQLFPEEAEAALQHHLAAENGDDLPWRQRRHDGVELRVCISAHAMPFRGRPARMVIARDVTQSLLMLDVLRASERRFREMFERSPGLICEHDLDGTLLAINPAAAQALGYEVAELIGVRLHALVPDPFAASVSAYLSAITVNGEFEGVMTVATRDQHWRALRFHNRLYSEPGREPFVVGHAQDVTEVLRREERWRMASLTDPLTGALNRRYLAQFAQRAERWGCIVVDLDGFKAINDRDGHRRGDEILVQVVQFLQTQARRDDVVVRLGGDEFLLLQQGRASDDTVPTAQALVAAAEHGAPCRMSVGWAVREDDESFDDTLGRADAMLYRERARRREQRQSA